jgi:hypothetical protein
VWGSFNERTRTLWLDFSRELQPGHLDPNNFHLRNAEQFWTFWTIQAIGARVSGKATPGPAVPPGKWITYYAQPPELKALDGTPAPGFQQFPLT